MAGRHRRGRAAACAAVAALALMTPPAAVATGRAAAWVPDDPDPDARHVALATARVPEAWDVARGAGVVVAVVSDGVRTDEADLAGALRPGLDLLRDGGLHGRDGTLLALLVGARADDATGSAGVAPEVSVLPVRTSAGDPAQVAQGVRWAADQGADVVLLGHTLRDDSADLLAAVRHATAAGAVVVVGAGDAYGEAAEWYPAAHAPDVPGMLGVVALGPYGSARPVNAYGDRVSLSAPTGGPWRAVGTSAEAAAVVAGAAALVRGQHPDWSAARVTERLTTTSRDAGPRGVDPYFGRGVLDAAAAVGLGAGLPFAPGLALLPGDDGTDDVAAGATPLQAVGIDHVGTGALDRLGDTDWFLLPDAAPGVHTVSVLTTVRGTPEPIGFDAVDADGEPLEQTFESTIPGTVHVERRGPVLLRIGPLRPSGTPGEYGVRVTPGAPPLSHEPPYRGQPEFVHDVTPANGEVGVAPRPAIGVGLWREPAPGAVDARTVRLVDGTTGADVPATRTVDEDGRLSVVPDDALVPGRHYELVVDGLVDVGGVRQEAAFRSWFTVGAGGDRFTPLPPRRVLDTREGPGAAPVAPGRPRVLDPFVDLSATAVVLNVTAVAPSGTGNVRVVPTPDGPGPLPEVSHLNVVRGVDQPNLVTVPLGVDGTVTLATEGMTAHLVADVAGWYGPDGAAGFVPTEPVRLLDTRDGTGGVPPARVAAGRWVELQVTGRHGVPEDALAVVLNVTGTQVGGPTNVRVYPTPPDDRAGEVPTVSNLNLRPGRDQPNAVAVAVGARGRIRLYTQSADVHLLADLAGYYTTTGDHGFVPLEPTRIADTRRGLGLPGALRPGATATLRVGGTAGVPATAGAAVLNVTAVAPDAVSNVRTFPASPSGAVPLVSTLNVVPGRDEPNHAVARLGAGGGVSFFSESARLGLVVDVGGYFTR